MIILLTRMGCRNKCGNTYFKYTIIKKGESPAQVRQSKGKSEKQQANEQSKKALKALQKWRRDFLYIARHALQDNKQLEALGRVV